MAGIKTKGSRKYIGKGQRMVFREVGWEGSQGAGVRTQHLSVVWEHSRPVALSCNVLIILAFDSWEQIGWSMGLLCMPCRVTKKLTESPLQGEHDPPSHCPTIAGSQEKILQDCECWVSMGYYNSVMHAWNSQEDKEWAHGAMEVVLGGTRKERMTEYLCTECHSLAQQNTHLSAKLCVSCSNIGAMIKETKIV